MRARTLAVAVGVAATGGAACGKANAPAIAGATTALAVNAAAKVIEAAGRPSSEQHSAAASADDPPPSFPTALDAEHARTVLLERDISRCWPPRLAHGPATVQVTFRGNGTTLRVGVAQPKEGPQIDAPCVAELLRDVIVDPFLAETAVVTVTYGEP